MSPWTRVDLAAKAALTGLLAFALTHPGWHQFSGKAMAARAIGYPLLVSLPVLIWLALRRRGIAYPGLPSFLLTLPFLVDMTGNALDLYDSVERFDDLCHFGNWALLSGALGVLLARRDDLPGWAVAPLCAGFGAVTAVFWELAEYVAFVRDSPEAATAYEDTVLDLVLGTSGSVVAGLVCLWSARRWAAQARRTEVPYAA